MLFLCKKVLMFRKKKYCFKKFRFFARGFEYVLKLIFSMHEYSHGHYIMTIGSIFRWPTMLIGVCEISDRIICMYVLGMLTRSNYTPNGHYNMSTRSIFIGPRSWEEISRMMIVRSWNNFAIVWDSMVMDVDLDL